MITFIVILLGIIACSEISRLILTHKKTSKKSHFKQKLEGTQKMIWDLEFKIFKTREIREDIRKEYESMQSRIQSYKQQIKDGVKGLDDQLILAERDAGRFLGQIKQLDLETEGSKPTSEYPEGVIGIGHQIASLRELQEMLKSWIKKLHE